MMWSDASSWDRRHLLKLLGISAAGTIAVSEPGAANEEEVDVSVKFGDQESDGSSVVIESLHTEVEAEVIIFHAEGDRKRYRVLNVEAGTEFSDRTIELDEPIPETQLISVSVQPPEGGYSYGGARATVAVGESLDDGGPTIELIEADSDAGFHYPYYLYIPEEPPDAERPIFVEPNNSPSSDDDYEVHLERAGESVERLGGTIAEYFRSPALVPAFPRFRNEPVSWRVMIQSLDPNVLEIEEPPLERIDRQLLNMLEDATERLEAEGYEIAERIHLNGFSQSATFANRFTVLHPEKVSAVTCGGNGFGVLPKETRNGRTLPYPAGVADLEELVGKDFDLDAWQEVDQYIYVGDEDQPLPETDSRGYRGFETLGEELEELMIDVFGKNRVTERFPVTRLVYEESGASTEFEIYDDVGHATTPEIREDVREFHRAHMNAPQFDFTVDRSADELEIGDTVTLFVEMENLIGLESTATLTLSVENGAETVETMDVPVEASSTETLELDYTFTEPGEYVLHVNETRAGSSLTVMDAGPTDDDDTEETDDPPSDETGETDDSNSERKESTVEEQPGFGVVQAIAALGGIGHLIGRRIADTE